MGEQRMIFDGEPIPIITEIIFDIPYCWLCRKMAKNIEITIGRGYIKKKRKNINQPHYCNKCIRCAETIKYGKNYPSIDSVVFISKQLVTGNLPVKPLYKHQTFLNWLLYPSNSPL